MKPIVAIALALLAAHAPAKMPAELNGYKDLKFGMTPEQLQGLYVDATCRPGAMKSTVACTCPPTFDLVGVPVRMLVVFTEQKLSGVALILAFPESMGPSDRLKKYEELSVLISGKYGPPDSNEKPGTVIADITYRGASWAASWNGPNRRT
jgi:hypothetical protein